jgi:hypothetical protein
LAKQQVDDQVIQHEAKVAKKMQEKNLLTLQV